MGWGCTPKNLGWGGCAARFSKSLPYFTPKDVIFHTRFQTWPLKSIPVFKPGGGHKTQHTCLRRQKLDHHYWDESANKKKYISKNLFRIRSIWGYVIHRLGGPYCEKLCPRSWIPPEAVGRERYSDRPRTDLGRWITSLFFSYWDLKVSGKFYFSLQPMCVEEGRVRVDVIQSARSIANQNKTLQHDF